MNTPTVHDVRLFPKVELDGTTVTSADLELSGPLRTLAWAVVVDDAARMGLHMLIDSHDVDACAALAPRIAPGHLGHPLTSGMWAVTTTRFEDAVVDTYPGGRRRHGRRARPSGAARTLIGRFEPLRLSTRAPIDRMARCPPTS